MLILCTTIFILLKYPRVCVYSPKAFSYLHIFFRSFVFFHILLMFYFKNLLIFILNYIIVNFKVNRKYLLFYLFRHRNLSKIVIFMVEFVTKDRPSMANNKKEPAPNAILTFENRHRLLISKFSLHIFHHSQQLLYIY